MAAPKKINASSQPTHGIGTALLVDRREQGHVDKAGVVSRKKPDRFASFVERMATRRK